MTKTVYVVRLPCGKYLGGSPRKPRCVGLAYGTVSFDKARIFLRKSDASQCAREQDVVVPCTVVLGAL